MPKQQQQQKIDQFWMKEKFKIEKLTVRRRASVGENELYVVDGRVFCLEVKIIKKFIKPSQTAKQKP